MWYWSHNDCQFTKFTSNWEPPILATGLQFCYSEMSSLCLHREVSGRAWGRVQNVTCTPYLPIWTGLHPLVSREATSLDTCIKENWALCFTLTFILSQEALVEIHLASSSASYNSRYLFESLLSMTGMLEQLMIGTISCCRWGFTL